MNLMLPDSGLLFWMTIIFLIVFLILARFGFPVITGMVEKRTRRIDDALSAARKAEEAIAHLSQEQDRVIAETRAQQARMMQEAAAERDRMISEARETAAAEAGRIVEDARLRIQEEKEAALREARSEIARLSIAVAEKILIKELSAEQEQKDFADRIVRSITPSDNEEV